MNREEKSQIIQQLSEQLEKFPHFYITDTSAMTVKDSNALRSKLYEQGLSIQVVKNTLFRKALENFDGKFDDAVPALKGTSAIVFTEIANAPAKVIKDFRKKSEKPLLKAAMIDEDIYIGDEHIDSLAALKSKEDLLAEIIGLLQSPAKNVVSALKSSGGTLAGLLKTLSEKEN